MKHIIYTIITAVFASAMLSSCVKDLDALPLNETDFTSETAYDSELSYLEGLTYINAYWALASQNDPGVSDITAPDAGQSELLRQWINLNELSADSFKCVWGDTYITSLQTQTWTPADNQALNTVYTRCLKGIALANEYLLQTEDSKLDIRGQSGLKEKVHGFRAEARFLRALYFWALLDQFGNPPFAQPENIGGKLPIQIGRDALYNWIEEELLELTEDGSDMPEKGEVEYPRPTKGAVWALLSRLYLNAEVYTGTEQWQSAKNAAAKVIDMGYALHNNYQEMFMEDNGENGASEEFIFAIAYDRNLTMSWGGTSTMRSASLDEAANLAIGGAYGVAKINTENWGGYHVADDYVARFELKGVDWTSKTGFGYDREDSDKRAFFYNGGHTKEFSLSKQATGWFCWKFSGLRSDGTVVTDAEDNYKFSSCDFPMFRLAEMYLIYAECDARMNGGYVTDAVAKGYIKALRDRAGVTTPNDMSLDWLLDERARELMWEGHRRTDLVRYGYYTSMKFPWTMKGGIADGKIALPEYRNIYPIITSDLMANPNLKQNFGY